MINYSQEINKDKIQSIVSIHTKNVYLQPKELSNYISEEFTENKISELLRILIEKDASLLVYDLMKYTDNLNDKYQEVLEKMSESTFIPIETLTPAIDLLCLGLNLNCKNESETQSSQKSITEYISLNKALELLIAEVDLIAESCINYNDFELIDGELINYKGSSAFVVLPFEVTSICDNAFKDCENLKEVILPNSIKTIGINAFKNCKNLKLDKIPSSLYSVSIDAFDGCNFENIKLFKPNQIINYSDFDIENNELKKYLGNSEIITIPYDITKILDLAFCECASVTEIIIPNSVTHIGILSFSRCSNLSKINIPNSVTNIGLSAFSFCTSLTKIKMPKSLTHLGTGVFDGCSKLKDKNIPDFDIDDGWLTAYYGSDSEITIPNSVKIIDAETFIYCTNITKIIIPTTVTSIRYYAFMGLSNLTKITIPNSVKFLADNVFDNCSSLEQIYIPNSVENDINYEFHGCSSLNKITAPNLIIENGVLSRYTGNQSSFVIPNFINSIGDNAFENCLSLTEITIPNSVTSLGKSAFINCNNLTKVTLSNKITHISENMFYSCHNLKNISLPNSVKFIGKYAFNFCSELETIYFKNNKISIMNGAFAFCPKLTKETQNILNKLGYKNN